MKLISTDVLSGAPKIATAVALSTLLVACGGGGTSGDGTTAGDTGLTDTGATDTGIGDLDLDNGIADVGGTVDSGTVDTGFTDVGTTDVSVGDGFTEDGLPDADNDGISDTAELDPCKGRGGEDTGSIDNDWSNNCNLEYRINSDEDNIVRSPFYNSLYVVGAQRVLYCRGHGGVVASTDAFADGFFGLDTLNALRSFQSNEDGLSLDGEIGPMTWGRMQALVDAAYIDTVTIEGTDYDLHGVVPDPNPELDEDADFTQSIVDCSMEANFAGRIGSDLLVEGWELTKTPVSGDFTGIELNAFSISTPPE